jgi:hypothetical protein
LEFFKSGERGVGKIGSYETDNLARGNGKNGRQFEDVYNFGNPQILGCFSKEGKK